MNNIIFNHILKNFLSTLLLVVITIYCFGIILNLFEEIEFFKNTQVGILTPVMLTSIFVPGMIIKLLPFIIFIACMRYLLKIRNNKDLLILKVYGYSNLKIFLLLALISFVLGWLVLSLGSPITSSMLKYYEKTKSQHAKDIEHLIAFNNNGLWIKEKTINGERVITAKKTDSFEIIDVTIFEFDKNYNLKNKIFSKKINIKNNNWKLRDVSVFKYERDVFTKKDFENYEISSIYNYEKISNMFNNSDTISFLDLIFKYDDLLKNGYKDRFLQKNLHSMLTLPFFLFLMTSIASILSMHTLKKSDSYKFILIGIIVCVLIYYLKDFSIALGETGRIPLILSIWTPILTLSLVTLIGILQINEK